MEMVSSGGSYFQSLLPSIMLQVNLKYFFMEGMVMVV